MNKLNIKEVVESLIDTFFHGGKISLDLRNNGLTKKIKSDNTPVSNGDIEVNKIITNKIVINSVLEKKNITGQINIKLKIDLKLILYNILSLESAPIAEESKE